MHAVHARPERRNDALARELMPLVRQVAGQVARRLPIHVPREDLVAAGMEGLAAAINRFDPERAETFRTYAEFRIRGAIIDDVRKRDLISRKARTKVKGVQEVSARLRRELDRWPTDEEVAEEIEATVDAVREVRSSASSRSISWDVIPEDDEAAESSARGSDPELEAGDRQQAELLYRAIDGLPERTRRIIHLYYFDDLTLREIADRLGISLSRVCQIRRDAERRLRRRVPRPSSYASA